MQADKLIYTNEKLGAQIVAKGQPTERILYDTESITLPVLGSGTFNFFSNTANKTPAESNFQPGILDNGESMILKSISFTDLASGADEIGANAIGLINVKVGNQQVIKDLPLQISSLENRIHVENIVEQQTNQWSYRLLTDIVIPPEVTLQVSLTVQNSDSVATKDANLICHIRGLGVLFNPNTAL